MYFYLQTIYNEYSQVDENPEASTHPAVENLNMEDNLISIKTESDYEIKDESLIHSEVGLNLDNNSKDELKIVKESLKESEERVEGLLKLNNDLMGELSLLLIG